MPELWALVTSLLAPFAALLSPAGAVSVLLVLVLGRLLRRLSRTPYLFALLSLLGTFLHELSHWVMGALLGAKPASVRLFPYRAGNLWVLGSVTFERMTLWNSALVALAPLLLWWLGPWILLGPMQQAWAQQQFGAWVVWGYACSVCLGSGWPSSTDWRVAAHSLGLYLAAGGLLWWSLR